MSGRVQTTGTITHKIINQWWAECDICEWAPTHSYEEFTGAATAMGNHYEQNHT